MLGAIFKSVFYIHAEYTPFSADILNLKGEKKEEKSKQPFQARENMTVSQFHSQEHLGIKKNLFCMLKQLGTCASELNVRS